MPPTHEDNPIRDIVSRLVLLSPELCAQRLTQSISDEEDGIHGEFLRHKVSEAESLGAEEAAGKSCRVHLSVT